MLSKKKKKKIRNQNGNGPLNSNAENNRAVPSHFRGKLFSVRSPVHRQSYEVSGLKGSPRGLTLRGWRGGSGKSRRRAYSAH